MDKIEIIEKSLFALDFPDESFDIIWAEGSISAIGFEEDLKQWRRFLKLHGFLVIHDNISDITKMLKLNKYTQLRLFLKGDEEEDAWLVLEGSKGLDGLTSTESLEIPSSATSGIKLNRPFEIVAGMITKLTIDFDAKKSVIKTGNGEYKLKPVISMVAETYSEEEELPEGSGSVSGTVSYYDSQNPELVRIGGASVSLSGGEYIFNNTTTTS